MARPTRRRARSGGCHPDQRRLSAGRNRGHGPPKAKVQRLQETDRAASVEHPGELGRRRCQLAPRELSLRLEARLWEILAYIEGNTMRWTVTVEELMRVMRRPELLATDRPDLPSRDACSLL
ncbi:hypothetical protein THIOKS12920002 [Thiocapsa sp. KS1]|nr:hypothetical protein THIOKS12920002 [Thiocapsa sp. KS1]